MQYVYDESGNISEIKENSKLSVKYSYDKLNRIIREDNSKLNITKLFSYDNNGNILTKRETSFSVSDVDEILNFSNEIEYTYDSTNPDRLLAFGNEDIANYDSIGNPTKYRGKSLYWKRGRQLSSIYLNNGEKISLEYDAYGKRIEKNTNETSAKYIYSGNNLIREERSDKENMSLFGDDLITGDARMVGQLSQYEIEYLYGQEGITAILYEGKKYYYRRNIQGDILRIFALDGTLEACYTYDAWGNHIITDEKGKVIYNSQVGITEGYERHIGNINPIRYRGYYYDTETRLYYCASRYYDPEVGRWINADSIEYLDPH